MRNPPQQVEMHAAKQLRDSDQATFCQSAQLKYRNVALHVAHVLNKVAKLAMHCDIHICLVVSISMKGSYLESRNAKS